MLHLRVRVDRSIGKAPGETPMARIDTATCGKVKRYREISRTYVSEQPIPLLEQEGWPRPRGRGGRTQEALSVG